MPDSNPVNLVTEKFTDSRVYVSTYPTMMGQINEIEDGLRRFGVGHFDLVIIDEAHRSTLQPPENLDFGSDFPTLGE